MYTAAAGGAAQRLKRETPFIFTAFIKRHYCVFLRRLFTGFTKRRKRRRSLYGVYGIPEHTVHACRQRHSMRQIIYGVCVVYGVYGIPEHAVNACRQRRSTRKIIYGVYVVYGIYGVYGIPVVR